MKAAFKRIVVKQRENYPWCFVKSRKIPETFHYPSIVLPFKTIIFPFFIFTTNNLESFSSNCNYHRNINLKNTLFKASQFPRHSTNSKERIERITIPSLPTLRYPSPLSPFRAKKPGRGVLLKRDNETSERWKRQLCGTVVTNIRVQPLLTRSRCLEWRLIHRRPRGLFRFHSVLIVLRASDILSTPPRPRDRSLNRLDAIFIVHYSATESRRDNIKAVIFRIRLLFLLYIYIQIHNIYIPVYMWSGNEATASPPGAGGLSVVVGGKRFERSEPPPFLISY